MASRIALFETRSINMAGLFGESVGQFLSRQLDLPLTGGGSFSETWEEEQSYRGREKRLWIRIPTGPLSGSGSNLVHEPYKLLTNEKDILNLYQGFRAGLFWDGSGNLQPGAGSGSW